MERRTKSGCWAGLLALGLLAACGAQQAGEEKAKVNLEKLDPRGQQIVFWYQHTREREQALQDLIADFNQSNEHGIQVRGEFAGDYGDIYNKMAVGMQGGVLPHLVVAYQNQALAYHRDGGVVDLLPYIQSPRWGLSAQELDDFVQAFVLQDRIDGVQVGFPPNRSMEIFFYNKDWLRELGFDGPPATWEEFARMCRRAREQPFSRSADKSRSLGFLLEADASRLASMVFSRGGQLMNEAQSAYALNTPQVRASLELMRDLRNEGVVGLMSEDYGDQREFAVGQVLFAMRSSSGLPFFASAVHSGLAFEWGVTHPPDELPEPVVNVYGASLSVCRTTPAGQLAAWLFLKWFTEPAQQARWVRASNYFPVRKSTARQLEDYFRENPKYGAAYELLDYGRSEPAVAGYQQVRRLIQEAMVEIIEGAAAEEVLAEVERQANRTLSEN